MFGESHLAGEATITATDRPTTAASAGWVDDDLVKAGWDNGSHLAVDLRNLNSIPMRYF